MEGGDGAETKLEPLVDTFFCDVVQHPFLGQTPAGRDILLPLEIARQNLNKLEHT